MTGIPTFGTSRPLISAAMQNPPSPQVTQWQDLGVVEQIANTNQPPLSRAIVQLQPYGHRIFLGYGEWDVGLDHCDLIAWNTESSALEILTTDVATDAFWALRVVNNELWALVTDPAVGTDPDAAVFDGQNTRIVNDPNINPWHLFDIQEWKGALYLAGANRVGDESYAAIWRSIDGGTSWEITFQTRDILRMHGLFNLGDLFYAVGVQGEAWTTIDGQSWIATPTTLLPRGSICVHPMVIAETAVYLNGWPAYGPQGLCEYDGQQARIREDIGSVVSASVDGASITVLTEDRRILQSTDLSSWEVVDSNVPVNGRSICAHDGSVYIGTADSHLWTISL